MESLVRKRVKLGKNQYEDGDETHQIMRTPESWFKDRIDTQGKITHVSTGFFNITVKFDKDGYTNDFNIDELIFINPNKRIS